MSTVTTYRFELDRTSKKWPCPQCGRRRFVRCRDNDLNEYLPEHVGRCDRENGCGYEFTWNQFVAERKSGQGPLIKSVQIEEPQPTAFIPVQYALRTIERKHYEQNNFFAFLTSLFGLDTALELRKKYLIGTSAYWKGAHVYWQIDAAGNLRQCKIMLSDAITGKRQKEGAMVERLDRKSNTYVLEVAERPCSMVYGKYLDENTKGLNLQQCFFGEHLLTEYPNAPVCIVESEKTAIIASVHLPAFVWLATGGASGCKWRDYATYKILQGRSVTFFPDHGFFNLKTGKTCYEEWSDRCERIREALPGTRILVSDLLEKRLADTQRQDQDLADLLLTQTPQNVSTL